MNLPNSLPTAPLDLITERFDECLLIGAHARDHVVTVKAGLEGSRLTHDLDFAVAVSSLEDYASRTDGLDSANSTGMRFEINGVSVDLIPFHPEGIGDPLIEVSDGIQTDTTGREEAFATGEPLPGHALIRVPTLQAMLVLKAVAWRIRGLGPNKTKDATDIALLLECLDAGEYGDRWLSAPDAVLEHYEFDSEAISAHLTGQDAARDLPIATASVLEVWSDERLPLAASKSGVRRKRYSRILTALATGATEYLPQPDEDRSGSAKS